ncbi:heme ABC transporter ATP-binding protein [Streptomyces antibioticus]|uniref:Heme ABC transporter ATP-binding protein n=1 Tax=Streptomyces antibioticus TaxID=1890 RepID=A0AAE7CL06_STRAT|nr:heme ABC transporter ATP-binding protein [Streptomyces antibioticus]OOQ53027.1 hemin ABC transporter ATP-binding protein [Streptomyces antibioticus]QIT44183.1 heme ABC transporter ATP-binding protein [Streptomyces antibioticus]
MRVLRGRALPPEGVARGDVVAEADGVWVRLGGREVLRGVDVRVRAGEVLALVGPNGAGKSTLLAALAADLPASSGTVRIHGRPAGGWSAPELALRRAVLPQAAVLSFPFTVADVVRMGRAPHDSSPAEDEAVIAEAMAATEVTDFAARPFSALSGGERARVALARVLAQRAPLLLLDEPTAALDLKHQELVLRLCRERAREGDAVVVVLHDLGLAAAYAHRVAVLHEGRVAADGPPAEVFTGRLLSEVYDQPVEVLPHPRTGALLVTPERDPDKDLDRDPDRDLERNL